jgi:hypothetical protein
MKHILPILTLTTLTAAAFADAGAAAPAAAASGLSYNRVGINYATNNVKGYSLSASSLIGNSNVLLEAATTIGGNSSTNGDDGVAIGYVFKNVLAGADAILSVGSNESYGIMVRKDLGSNVEGSISYDRVKNSSNKHVNVMNAEVAYNLTKQYQVAVGYASKSATSTKSTTSVSVRYNF